MSTFFIHPDDPLAIEVWKQIKDRENLGLFISPRGTYDHLNTPCIYGVYTNQEDFENCYQNEEFWGYMTLDNWIHLYRKYHEL